MIKCNVVIHMPAALAREVFTRRKAWLWCHHIGVDHVLNQKCGHPECKKTRKYIQRGIIYKTDYNSLYYVRVGHNVNPAIVEKNKTLLTVKP